MKNACYELNHLHPLLRRRSRNDQDDLPDMSGCSASELLDEPVAREIFKNNLYLKRFTSPAAANFP